MIKIPLPIIIAFILSGCVSYVTPGKRAELDKFVSENMEENFSAQPSKPFPASIAIVRLQGADYTNHNLERNGGIYGNGSYSAVLVREVENENDILIIADLPQVKDVVFLNKLLLPDKINSHEDVRIAASKLKADLIFVYTFDTKFFYEDQSVPLTVVSLGLSPTRKILVSTTASALLIDTRTGYIYGAFESSAKEVKRSTSWGILESSEKARLKTEESAFEGLLYELISSWSRILE